MMLALRLEGVLETSDASDLRIQGASVSPELLSSRDAFRFRVLGLH